MSDNGYFDIYLKRVNRYGEDYKTRVLNQRREVFDRRLERSFLCQSLKTIQAKGLGY